MKCYTLALLLVMLNRECSINILQSCCRQAVTHGLEEWPVCGWFGKILLLYFFLIVKGTKGARQGN